MDKPPSSVKVPGPRLSKRRPSAAARVFGWTFLILLLVGLAVGAAALYVDQVYVAPGPLAEDKVYVVEPGGNARIFAVMAYFTGTRMRLKAGEYAFTKAMPMQDVMALIASGKSITYKLSVPEGFTSEMAVARVNANDVLAGPPAIMPPEGSIMPDTYVFRRGMTRQKLVEDMQAAQTKLLDDLWLSRLPEPVIDSKDKAVTLASIVEKETAVAEERPIIASVFINRLKKGMRLQSDPTIIYGIAGGKGKLDRPLSRADIEAETPYNTYRIKGLPPGPIANPGRAALEAVLNPQSTEYLYFVADGSGGHAFAATLEEHNRNVKKWRQIAGNAAAAAAAEEPLPADATAPDAAAAAPADASATPPAPVSPSAEILAAQPPAAAAAPPLAGTTPRPDTASAPAPAPASKPAAPAATTTAAPAAAAKPTAAAKPALKAGSVVMVGGKPVPIPRPKPKH